MATPTVRAGSSVQANFPGTSVTTTLTKPVGTAEGDLIVFAVGWSNGNPAFTTPPTGFAQPTGLTLMPQSGTSAATFLVKVAGAAEPADYAISWTNTSSGAWCGVAVSGADTAAWQDAAAQSVSQPAATAHVIPSVDPVVTDALQLAMVSADGLSGVTTSWVPTPSAMTEVGEGALLNFTANAALFAEALSTGTATATKTVTCSQSVPWVSQTITIKGAGGVTGPLAAQSVTATGWTATGGTALAVLTDTDAATYLQSPNTPSSSQVDTVVAGDAPTGDLVVTPDLSRQNGTSGSAVCTLTDGAGINLTASPASVAVGTTAASVAFTFTSAALSGAGLGAGGANVAKWGTGLTVRVSVTAS